jgi:hypothetical protein
MSLGLQPLQLGTPVTFHGDGHMGTAPTQAAMKIFGRAYSRRGAAMCPAYKRLTEI